MKHRNTTNRTFRTAGATMIALLAISTAACGGSTTIDSAANDTAVEAEAPAADTADDTADESASVDQAEQTSDTNDTASTQEAESNSSSSNSSSSDSSSSNSTSSDSSSSSSGSVQSQSDEPATEEPAAEEPAAEEPMAEEPAEAEPAAEEPAEEEPAAEEPAAEEPMAEEPAEEEPATEEPMAEEPAEEEPAAEEPAVREFLVNIIASNSYSVQIEASVPGATGSQTKGIASVCLVQYNEYGNALEGPSGMVTVDGVRYPALIAEGCRANDGNYGEYSYRWSLDARRSVNGNPKNYYDIAIRAEDGRVRVFCHDTTSFRNGFVERNLADYAGRTSLGPCPS